MFSVCSRSAALERDWVDDLKRKQQLASQLVWSVVNHHFDSGRTPKVSQSNGAPYLDRRLYEFIWAMRTTRAALMAHFVIISS